MTRIEMLGLATVVALSAGVGWYVGSQWRDDQPAAKAPVTAQAALPSVPLAVDSVSVLDDGTVSVDVRRAPIPWLLEEIARKGGHLPGVGGPEPVASGRAGPGALIVGGATMETEPRSLTRLLQTLREGGEAERLGALSEALANELEVPAAVLQQLVESDPSEQVRLAAFSAYVDLKADDGKAVRDVLDATRYNPSPALQAEARRRWEEYERAQRMQPVDDPQRRP